MAVAKTFISGATSGLSWHTRRPASPIVGDCYLDTYDGNGYIWQGSAWVVFSGDPHPTPPWAPPTPDQLEKHPALKAAWEELVVIRRLLGV